VFGDFDEDEDIDLVVANENQSDIFYSNQRMGVFRNETEKSGLGSTVGSTSVSAGDYTNDGYLDLLFTSKENGKHRLYRNTRTGYFVIDTSVNELFALTGNALIHDGALLDFDNDGSLDIMLAGEPLSEGERGLFLFHNNGIDGFNDVSHLLPSEIKSARDIAIFDYNDDGDIDLLLTGADGGIISHCIDPVTENNQILDAGANGNYQSTNYIAGLWGDNNDGTIIFQFNEVARTRKFIGDGQAFDTDWETGGTSIFQYNYTHENEGGFFLNCADLRMSPNFKKTILNKIF